MEYLSYFVIVIINLPFALDGGVYNILAIGFILGIITDSLIVRTVKNKYK
jgi:hypothetical protein